MLPAPRDRGIRFRIRLHRRLRSGLRNARRVSGVTRTFPISRPLSAVRSRENNVSLHTPERRKRWGEGRAKIRGSRDSAHPCGFVTCLTGSFGVRLFSTALHRHEESAFSSFSRTFLPCLLFFSPLLLHISCPPLRLDPCLFASFVFRRSKRGGPPRSWGDDGSS